MIINNIKSPSKYHSLVLLGDHLIANKEGFFFGGGSLSPSNPPYYIQSRRGNFNVLVFFSPPTFDVGGLK